MQQIIEAVGEFDPIAFDYPVNIIGCGGIGSRIAEGITRMGIGIMRHSPIQLYDPVFFKNHDLYHAWAYSEDPWKPKARVIGEQMQAINPEIVVTPHTENAGSDSALRGVVFVCVSNLSTSKTLVEAVLGNAPGISCVIETRILPHGIGSYCFNPRVALQQERWLEY